MGIGIKELIIILVIVMLLFGTKKIKGIGSDVGGWIRDFRKAMKDGNEEAPVVDLNAGKRVIDAEAVPSANEPKNG
jgi:sec-independent protein translocase protein TatA